MSDLQTEKIAISLLFTWAVFQKDIYILWLYQNNLQCIPQQQHAQLHTHQLVWVTRPGASKRWLWSCPPILEFFAVKAEGRLHRTCELIRGQPWPWQCERSSVAGTLFNMEHTPDQMCKWQVNFECDPTLHITQSFLKIIYHIVSYLLRKIVTSIYI